MKNSDRKRVFELLKKKILAEKAILSELSSLFNYLKNIEDEKEKNILLLQIKELENSLKSANDNIESILERISLTRPLNLRKQPEEEKQKKEDKEKKKKLRKFIIKSNIPKELKLTESERKTLKRLKKERLKITTKKAKKPSRYIKISNKFFAKISKSLSKRKIFSSLKKDLIRTNLQFIPSSYISVMLFTTLVSVIVAFFLFLLFLFFNFENFPIITMAHENFAQRFIKVFWIILIIPLATFIFMYLYPSMEKKSSKNKIDQELPFAAINMAAISQSMVEPSKIFSIIASTKEYPHLEKEFIKIINLTNIYGYDLVTALRSVSLNSPSTKLSDLLNGLATTITSGGNLQSFFEKRGQSLLFEYRLDREKSIKSSETFMDIYISVVIASPMILMLLLMIMKISGLGIALSSSMISLIMVLGVSMVNIMFLIFLHLRQSTE